METLHNYSCRRLKLCLYLLGALMASSHLNKISAQKLTAEELVSKHLAALGAGETRESVKTRITTGTVVVTFRGPGTGQLGGRVVLASEGVKNMLAMVFDNSSNYAQEKFGFDGNEVSASYVQPGRRSTLGDFLMTHKTIVKQGLVGGVLSQSWPLLDIAGRKSNLQMSGAKKIGDRQTFQLKYHPSGGSDLSVSLFFDSETFQHLRTEYTRTVTAPMGSTPETSAQESETRYRLVEDFSDYGREGGFTLPHTYEITLEITGRTGSFRAGWEMKLSEFAFNQRIDPASFDVDDRSNEKP